MHPFFEANPLYAGLFWSAFALRGLAEVLATAQRRSGADASRQDRGSRTTLLLALCSGLCLAFAFAWRLPRAEVTFRPEAVFAIGIAIVLLGVALRSYAMAVLGRFFTRDVTVQSCQTVIDHGPYRFVRHPCYSGSLLSLLGVGLALTNWASIAALLLCAAAGYGYRIAVEERALANGLGQPYLAYMRKTKRLIPFVV